MYIYLSGFAKNMATEISLLYPLTESCSGAFFIATCYLFNRYRKGHSR